MKVIAPPNLWYYQKLSNVCRAWRTTWSSGFGVSNNYWSSSQNADNLDNAWNANFNNNNFNNNNINNNNYVRLCTSYIILNKDKERNSQMNELTFEELYEAYILCLKNKKRKAGTYDFVNEDLCKNLLEVVD